MCVYVCVCHVRIRETHVFMRACVCVLCVCGIVRPFARFVARIFEARVQSRSCETRLLERRSFSVQWIIMVSW